MSDYSFKRDGIYWKWYMEQRGQKTGKPFRCVHASGLPVAEGAACTIDMLPDRFVIESSGTRFELAKAKIASIERVTRKQLTQVSKGSAGWAAMGGLAFGAVGAVVGASIGKTKTLKRYERFAAFTYDAGGGLAVLLFGYEQGDDQLGSSKQTLRKFIKDFEGGAGYGGTRTVTL